METVSLAILFAAHRPATLLVAILTGAPDSCRPAGFSRYVLLLPQSLLPRVFPRSACLCSRGVSQPQVSRRDGISLCPAKRPSLLFLSCGPLHRLPLA